MADTSVAIQIDSSGIPYYQSSSRVISPTWPSGSGLLSALLSSVPGVTVTPRHETVFLTRSQQRIMNGALRDSLRIIA
jgi:hypothetical protein